jgi:hypothetical protein
LKVWFAKNMSERSPFEFDNYRYEEISFKMFCEEFQLMLAEMRSDEYLIGFQDYFEIETGIDLSLSNINEEGIFEIFARYENFLQVEFGDGLGEVNLPDRIINGYQQTEVLPDKTQIPWLWVGVFNRDLNETRKKLLACKKTEDDSIHYWKLSEAQDSSPANISLEFRSVAYRLRGGLEEGNS